MDMETARSATQGYFEPRRAPSNEPSDRPRAGRMVTQPSTRPPPPPGWPGTASAPVSSATTPTSYGALTPHGPSQPPFSKPLGTILRKKTISKADISDPKLISSTSNIDTVDLPPGASLRNGMDTPSTASGKPRRRKTQRLFRFGHDGTSDEPIDKVKARVASPQPPTRSGNYTAATRSPDMPSPDMKSPEPWTQQNRSGAGYKSPPLVDTRPGPRNMRSDESIGKPAFPIMGSPEHPLMTEGGMF